MTEHMDEEFHRRLLAMVESMPAFPESVHQIDTLSDKVHDMPVLVNHPVVNFGYRIDTGRRVHRVVMLISLLIYYPIMNTL